LQLPESQRYTIESEALNTLARAAGAGYVGDVEAFNDADGRTLQEVLALYKKAIESVR
jgi:hypothetical protein